MKQLKSKKMNYQKYDDAIQTQRRIQKLGVLAEQLKLTESDLFLISDIKKNEKVDQANFIANHNIPLSDIEQTYEHNRLLRKRTF